MSIDDHYPWIFHRALDWFEGKFAGTPSVSWYIFIYVLYIIYCGLRENLQENPRFDGKNHGFRLGFSQQNLSGEAVYTGGSFSSKGGGIMRTLQALAQKVWGNWGSNGHGPKVSDPVVGWWNMALIFLGIRQLIPSERPSKTREHDD